MAKRQITFALQLYNMPEAAQIYVVVHEYCHFLQPNHSRAFQSGISFATSAQKAGLWLGCKKWQYSCTTT